LANRRIKRTKSFSSYIRSIENRVAALRAEAGVSGGIAPGSISASSLAQEVTLSANSIKSLDFVPGVQGWNISGTGVAEFSNIYVRGDINAETGTIGYWNISSPGVERTIGSRKLFGTFLESADFGASDDDVDSGVYVGLFKSYFEESVPVTGATRLGNVVTITAPNHGYLNGDSVIVLIDNDLTNGYGSGSAPALIIEVSKDTFKYQNSGLDTEYVDENGNFVNHGVTGTATLYVKDVAGLYLQDYGKKVFDYGYFSNEGVAYASAETFNLVHNPSLEYEVDGTNASSITSWSRANTSAVTITGVAFNNESSPINNLYRGGSEYGLNVSWTSTPADASVSVVSNYSLVDDLVSDDPTLYLHLDVFAAPYNESSSVKVNSYTPSGNTIAVTTATAHGLAVGDYIYESFIVPAGSADIVTVPGGKSYVLKVTNVASNTVFSMNNSFGALPGFRDISDETASVVSKVLVPEFKITEIKFDFGNNSNPVQFLSVATDAWIAEYNENQYNGKLSLTESEVNSSILNDHENNQILVKNAPALGIVHRPTSGAHRLDLELAISLSKLYKAYRAANPAGLAAMENFKIVFPAKIYPEGSGSAISAGSYTIDNVSLSTEKRFFYAESSPVSYSWHFPADKPNTASVQDTKQWLDINLTNQTASYKYTDSFEFKSPSFSNDLTVNSGVYTINNLENEEILWQGLHSDATSSNLFVSSGAYTKPSELTAGAEITMQSYSLSIVSPSHTSYQISSDLNYANAATGEYIRTHAASIALDSYEDETFDEGGYKRDRGSQIWASADNIIFSTRNEIIGENKNLTFSVYGKTELSGDLVVKSAGATVSVPIVNAGSADNHAATVKFVKDSRQAYYLPTSNVSEATYANSKRIYISNTAPNAGTLGDIWVKI
jgi:hypothetical protein